MPHDADSHERHERRQNPPIASEQVRCEDKRFYLDLKENGRGQFIQITERFGERRNCVVIPAEKLDEILTALESLRAAIR